MAENIPSKDPADDDSFPGMLRSVMRKMAMNTDDMLPAVVISYDRETNMATVRPVVALLTTGGDIVPRAQIASVPVLALGGGGFVVNFPLRPKDLGWIKASDRDISLFRQGMQADLAPNTRRLHSFEDGLFIPSVFTGYDVSDVGADAMTIQSLDGAVRVELSPARIRMVAPDVLIDAENTRINSNVETFGTLKNNGVNVGSTHTHGGVQTGGGNTAAPNP